jgi:hypothetical protein
MHHIDSVTTSQDPSNPAVINVSTYGVGIQESFWGDEPTSLTESTMIVKAKPPMIPLGGWDGDTDKQFTKDYESRLEFMQLTQMVFLFELMDHLKSEKGRE